MGEVMGMGDGIVDRWTKNEEFDDNLRQKAGIRLYIVSRQHIEDQESMVYQRKFCVFRKVLLV